MRKLIFPILLIISSWQMLLGQENRTTADLGVFSISLTVEDIQASYDFYTELGFTPIEGAGSIEQKWMILKNGTSKLGIFQGLFPSNMLTFNPDDARSIYALVEQAKIPLLFSQGLDKANGPCAFSFVDPDGNTILIDQHK